MSDDVDLHLLAQTVAELAEQTRANAEQGVLHNEALFGKVISDEDGIRRTPGLFDRMDSLTEAITSAVHVLKVSAGVVSGALGVLTLAIGGPLFVEWVTHHVLFVPVAHLHS